ncbi:MAG TPA: hypothetical protein VNS63_07240 [Blastocatellia bacterium]|nr:hypothetical protein [Blastocatellia bacterium]
MVIRTPFGPDDESMSAISSVLPPLEAFWSLDISADAVGDCA